VTAFDILRLTSAANQNLALAVLQVEHCHLCVLDETAGSGDCEQDRLSTGQDRWKQMIPLAMCRIWRRQNRRLPPGCGHAEQAAAGVGRREHD